MAGRGEEFSRATIKDTWTKSKGGKIKGGKWEWVGWRGVMGETGDNCT